MERLVCKAMLKRLGWIDAVSSSMYDYQAINYIYNFRSLKNESVKTLCKVMRRPGFFTATGYLEPGAKVNSRAYNNLMLAVYFIIHRDRVSRDVTFMNVTLAGVRKLSDQREMEEDATEGSVTNPNVHTNNWSKALKGIEEYIRTFRGVNGAPLSYVVRK